MNDDQLTNLTNAIQFLTDKGCEGFATYTAIELMPWYSEVITRARLWYLYIHKRIRNHTQWIRLVYGLRFDFSVEHFPKLKSFDSNLIAIAISYSNTYRMNISIPKIVHDLFEVDSTKSVGL